MAKALRTNDVRGETDLVSLGTQDTLRNYLRSLWERREFVTALARNDLRARHMNSLLGQAWYILNPAINIAVYFLIFGVVLDGRRGVDNYVAFLVIGVMSFRLVQNTVINCASSMRKNLGLIRSIQFPRTLIPVSIVIENFLQFLPSLGLIMCVAVIDGGAPVWNWCAIPLVLAVTAMISLGIGLVVARIGAFLTDLQQLLPHFFRIMLYVSGVLFSVDQRISNETIKALFPINPFYDVIVATRWSLTGRPMDGTVVVALACWAVFSMSIGLRFFRRGEHRYGV